MMERGTASAPLRIGVLGAAAIAPAAIIGPAAANDRASVVAVAARDRTRAQAYAAKHGIDRVLFSYDELIDDPAIDAVYVPLPNSLHAEWTLRAIGSGKHVLCEKPFTANAKEATEVAAAARESGLTVMEAFHWRYHPTAQRIVDLVRRGELGRLQHVEASLCFPLLKRNDIRFRPELAGGALMDAGCYAVHMVRTVAGAEPERVTGTDVRLTKAGVDRYFHGDLQFAHGVTGSITCSLASSKVLSLRLRARGTDGELRMFNPVMPKLFGRLRVDANGRHRVEQPRRTDTYAHQLDAFIDAIVDGTPIPTDVDDAVKNMTAIDQLYAAAGLR